MNIQEILLMFKEDNEINIAKKFEELDIKCIVSKHVEKNKIFYMLNPLIDGFENVIYMNPDTKHKLLSTNKWLEKYLIKEGE